ncbi:MAG: 2'-5' RNA ligase family protein [Planctomycetes bacterium]|nr:2'-5' RNA ligase family protein [Planctomycetota bacterium]
MNRQADSVPLFFSLEPDPALTTLILDYKQRTRRVAGDQLYLSDPPHLTVYLAAFASSAKLDEAWDRIVGRLVAPTFEITGWHLFEQDALTGRQTLVCDLCAADRDIFRALQRTVVDAAAPWRDRRATEQRYAGRLDRLQHVEREQVERVGFPFVGDGWHPHFSIASIATGDWPRVRAELWNDPPRGRFTCPRLQLYELHDGHPRLVRSSSLATGV